MTRRKAAGRTVVVGKRRKVVDHTAEAGAGVVFVHMEPVADHIVAGC